MIFLKKEMLALFLGILIMFVFFVERRWGWGGQTKILTVTVRIIFKEIIIINLQMKICSIPNATLFLKR